MILPGGHLVHGLLAGPSRHQDICPAAVGFPARRFRERVGTGNTLQAGCGISVSVGRWEESVADTTSRHMEVSQGVH